MNTTGAFKKSISNGITLDMGWRVVWSKHVFTLFFVSEILVLLACYVALNSSYVCLCIAPTKFTDGSC